MTPFLKAVLVRKGGAHVLAVASDAAAADGTAARLGQERDQREEPPPLPHQGGPPAPRPLQEQDVLRTRLEYHGGSSIV